MASNEAKSGIQEQVEAGVQEASKGLLDKISARIDAALGKESPEFTQAKTTVATQATRITTLEGTVSTQAAEIIKLNAKVAELDGTASQARTEAEKAKVDAEAKVDAKEKEVASRANHKAKETLAKAGHEGVAAETVETAGAGKTKASLWAEYAKIEDLTEKRAFYLANRALMTL